MLTIIVLKILKTSKINLKKLDKIIEKMFRTLRNFKKN